MDALSEEGKWAERNECRGSRHSFISVPVGSYIRAGLERRWEERLGDS